MRYLYTILLYLATPFIMLRLLWRSRKAIGYRQRWKERFAFISPIKTQQSIWLHAVSLGETLAATPLIKSILSQFPQYTLVITTTTPTGSSQVIKQFGNQVYHVYTPYDLPNVIKRFLNNVKPIAAIIMETELWPNLLYYTKQRNVPLIIANARLSERSYQGYQRIAKLTQQMLNQVSTVAAQSKQDGQRFQQLGLPADRLTITGNIKFDMQLPEDISQKGSQLKNLLGNRFTWIAASTHEGEENIILNAHQIILKSIPDCLLILVPRHPERFNRIAQLCQQYAKHTARRSLKELPEKNTPIYLGDTLGELRLFYAASDVAFVGGSLVPVGGHNLIEPAALKLPIICGPNLQNTIAVKKLLIDADGIMIVNDAATLAEHIIKLYNNPQLSQTLGENAFAVSHANRGAVNKHMALINHLITHCSPTV